MYNDFVFVYLADIYMIPPNTLLLIKVTIHIYRADRCLLVFINLFISIAHCFPEILALCSAFLIVEKMFLNFDSEVVYFAL